MNLSNAYQIGKIFAKTFCMKLVFNAKTPIAKLTSKHDCYDWVELINVLKQKMIVEKD